MSGGSWPVWCSASPNCVTELEDAPEPREASVANTETSDTTEPRSATEEPQESTSRPQEEEQRSWWRRVFGG